jgi:drug/metabolite transporter (DMT)-like permease
LLIGALFWTTHILVIDRVAKDIRPLHFALGQFTVCSVLGLITMFLFEEPTLSGILQAKWAIAYCGILSVGVAYTLQIISQKRADPTLAVVVLSTEAVFSAVGGLIFGIDTISLLGYVGCGVIFVGILLSQLSPKSKNENPPEG